MFIALIRIFALFLFSASFPHVTDTHTEDTNNNFRQNNAFSFNSTPIVVDYYLQQQPDSNFHFRVNFNKTAQYSIGATKPKFKTEPSHKDLCKLTNQEWESNLKSNYQLDVEFQYWPEEVVTQVFNDLEKYQYCPYRELLRKFPSDEKQLARVARNFNKISGGKSYKFQINGMSLQTYINKRADRRLKEEDAEWRQEQEQLKKEQLDYIINQESTTKERHEGRQKALAFANKHGLSFYSKYTLTSQTEHFLSQCKIDKEAFVHCTGNQLQQQVHCELLEAANDASDLYYKTKSPELKQYCSGVARSAEIGCKLNQQNNTVAAGNFADYCNHALAFGRGVIASCGKNVHLIRQAIMHPFDTMQELAVLASRASLSLAQTIIASGMVREYEEMAFYGGIDNLEDIEGYRCAKEHLEGTYRTIDAYLESVRGKDSIEACENLGYIFTDVALCFYSPKGAKLAKSNFHKAIDRGKKYISNFGGIGKESAKIVGIAGIEGSYRVEEAINILKQEGQALKPKNLYQQTKETAKNSAKTARRVKEFAVEEFKAMSKTADRALKKLDRKKLYKRRKKHTFNEKHDLAFLGDEKKAFNKFMDIIEEVNIRGLLREGDNQVISNIQGKLVEIRMHIRNGEPLSTNAFEYAPGPGVRKMYNRIIVHGEIL